ncbi:TetR/AcrR family transcriptional regulator C-terminal domain-containing protein [Nocardia bhagyanarayanae]|uniref:TetR family transcriptional regulator n=1 Tax=Nocardia bhagyanarayanae TaxID=1215925 RepID=A0A543F7V5_9NOCA|nr:TetR/AcrR family transcriptional regulator C-terminal domain-containing protein [Nocardia bhagyanarayanae]TQM29906.1 TetR family transcriptional regulator [Nocardia bhagyanarayanae]
MSNRTGQVKLDPEVIADAALTLLDEVGLDGLTMRKVAAALNVQAPALYWHVANKRELLDVMARSVFVSAVADVEAPRRGEDWRDWLIALAGRLRRAMLGYRDGAKVLAGTYISDESMWRTVELTLRTLEDAGFSRRRAARVFPILLHYTVGFVIEEQARTGGEYGDRDPYRPERLAELVDAQRFPLTAHLVSEVFVGDTDAEFADGLRVILAGIHAVGIEPAD